MVIPIIDLSVCTHMDVHIMHIVCTYVCISERERMRERFTTLCFMKGVISIFEAL